MKSAITILFLFYSLSAFSQQVKIIKRCIFDGNENFLARNTICEKMYFENSKLATQLNYAINGRQVIDSLVFLRTGKELCSKTYRPIYNPETRVIKRHELLRKECGEERVLQKPINQVNDKYGLSREYLLDLQFLLERNPESSMTGWQYKGGIIPSLLSQYGIPVNEALDSFNFVTDNSLIKNDVFYFESYTLTRKYKYDENRLTEVQIQVLNKQSSSMSNFKEYFTVLSK